ncbi:hypothetical protein PDO_4934, partial [Rhizobium sp. PDO1-076]
MNTSVSSVLRRARNRLVHATTLASIAPLMAAPAHASGSSMPWEEPLQQILESIGRAGGQDRCGDHHHRH